MPPVESEEEVKLANEMLAKANALLKKHNVDADPGALSDAQWNFVNSAQIFDGSVDWESYIDQFNFKM